MQSNWDTFYARVLKDEGTGYEDVRGDNGGPTCCGITIIDVARFYGLKLKFDASGRFIRGAGDWDKALALTKALNPSTASPIYKKFYWDDVRADDLPAGVDYMTVDYAVNSGPGRAVPTLTSLVGLPQVKSIDTSVLEAVRGYGDPVDLINHYSDARRDFLIRISDPNSRDYAHNYKFRKGWLDRVQRVRETAIAMAQAAKPVDRGPVVAQSSAPPKAMPAPTPPPPTKVAVARQSKSVWTGVVGLGLTAVSHVHTLAQGIGDVVRQVFDNLPDIVHASRDNVQAFTDLGQTVGAADTVATLAGVLGAFCVVVQILRHVDFKHAVMSEQKG